VSSDWDVTQAKNTAEMTKLRAQAMGAKQ
jgi:hypothetical protein